MQPATLLSPSEGPIVASPKQVMDRLQISRTTLYALLDRGELESYTEGKSRRITLQSIDAYVKRRLTAEAAKRGRVA